MAVYETPVRHEDHYIEHERSSGVGAGFWAIVAVLAVVLLLLLFGSNLFGTGGGAGGTGTDINGSGSVNTPGGTFQGSGSGTVQ